MGAIFYLIMDIIVHLGILKHTDEKVQANRMVVTSAIVLDLVVLLGFVWVKIQNNLTVVLVSLSLMVATFVGEKTFLENRNRILMN